MQDVEHTGSNPTDNASLADLIGGAMNRRTVLAGGVAAALLGFAGTRVASAGSEADAVTSGSAGTGRHRPLLGFTEVPVSSDDTLVVPPGYTAQVLIPWGTPLHSSGPAWLEDASNSAADQEQQVGMHHDGMHFFPLHRGRHGSQRGLLVVNHEYVDQIILNPDGATPMTAEKLAKALAAHGVTVIEIHKGRQGWRPVDSPLNRRITGTTPWPTPGPCRWTIPSCSPTTRPWAR
jgi:secreted PhoX family phosphatase